MPTWSNYVPNMVCPFQYSGHECMWLIVSWWYSHVSKMVCKCWKTKKLQARHESAKTDRAIPIYPRTSFAGYNDHDLKLILIINPVKLYIFNTNLPQFLTSHLPVVLAVLMTDINWFISWFKLEFSSLNLLKLSSCLPNRSCIS